MGSWSSTITTKVWYAMNDYTGYEQFCVYAYWQYRQDSIANQTEIRLNKLRFQETNQLCLGGCYVILYGGFTGNTTSGQVTLTQSFGPPYYVDVTINKSHVFDNDSDGYAVNAYFKWGLYVSRCLNGYYDYRTLQDTSASRTYGATSGSSRTSAIASVIPKLELGSVLTAPAGYIGQTLTLTVKQLNSSTTHTITYSFGSASGTICTKSSNLSISFTPPKTLANQIPSATKAYCTYTIKTYDGSTLVGTRTVQAYLQLPAYDASDTSTWEFFSRAVLYDDTSTYLTTGYKPWVDTNSKALSLGLIVQGYSKLNIKFKAVGAYSATITKCVITFDGKTYTYENTETVNMTTNTISGSGNLDLSIRVYDSRGRSWGYTWSSGKTYYVYAYAYTNPQITSLSVTRCNSDGSFNEDGTYLKWVFSYSITPLESLNSKKIQFQYKLSSASSYTTISADTQTSIAYSGSGISFVTSYGSISPDAAYDLRLVVSDTFTTSYATKSIAISFTLINYASSGRSLAFGQTCTGTDGILQNNLILNQDKPAYFSDSAYLANETHISDDVYYENVDITTAMKLMRHWMHERKYKCNSDNRFTTTCRFTVIGPIAWVHIFGQTTQQIDTSNGKVMIFYWPSDFPMPYYNITVSEASGRARFEFRNGNDGTAKGVYVYGTEDGHIIPANVYLMCEAFFPVSIDDLLELSTAADDANWAS